MLTKHFYTVSSFALRNMNYYEILSHNLGIFNLRVTLKTLARIISSVRERVNCYDCAIITAIVETITICSWIT